MDFTKVLVKPKSMGYCRRRFAIRDATGSPWSHTAAKENWHDPLPGSRAFSQYVELDPRIDVAALKSKLGPFPTKPAEQNALWYKLYKSVETDPRVLNVHRLFLLTRDYAGIAFMLLIVFGAIGLFAMQTYRAELFYVGALLVQFIASSIAARNYGMRFVNTVLALKAAE